MKHLVQRIVLIGVLLLVLLGLSVASGGAYDAGEVTGSDRMTAAPAASEGDAEIFPVFGTPELKEEYLTFIRERNLNTTEIRAQAAASDRVVRQYHPGDQEKFWCFDSYQWRYYEITATCQYAGSHGYIFVENGNPVSALAMADLGGAFDSVIYPTNTDTFGQDVDTDGDSKIFLLLLDIRDEWYYSGASQTYVCGYFNAINTWPSTYFPCSNEKDMIYLDTSPTTHNHRLQVTAHEFQHLIHNGYDEDEYTWVDEGCADYAEYACFGVLEDAHVGFFLDRPYVPLCDLDWSSYDGYDCLARYGASLLWTVYLSEQQGDLSGDPGRQHFIRDLVAEKKNGIAGIDAVLERYGEADRFESIFKRWVIANYLDDASRDPAYGYLQIDLPAKPAIQAEAALGTEPVSFPQNSLKSYATAYYTVEPSQAGSVVCSCDPSFYTWMSSDATSAMVLVSPLSDSGTYTLTVKPADDGTSLLPIPSQILAADYDAGGEGVAYHDTTPGNIDSTPSSYRNDDVDIGIRDWDADPLITNTAAGEWLRYTVDVAEAGTYDVEYLLYTTQAGCTLALDVDGVSAHQIAVPEASSWRTAIRVKGVATFPAAGEHVLTLQVSGDMNLNGMTFSKKPSVQPTLAIPGRILAADYDAGGEGVAYHDTTPGNIDSNPSSYRGDDVDIGIRDWDTDPLITNTAAGEWLRYTVDVAEAGAYEVEYLLYTTRDGCALALDVDGVSAHQIAVPEASSWRTEIQVKEEVNFSTAGEHVLILRLAGDMNLNGMTFVRTGPTSLDADFTASPTSGLAPLAVQFTDTSAGTPTAWAWTFGDGATSTDQHPVHVYTAAGTYTVSLTVNPTTDSDTKTKAGYITVDPSQNHVISIEWQRCLGGSYDDGAHSVQQTLDGGYILAGCTESNDGDVSGNHDDSSDIISSTDVWLVKIDAGGEIEWQRCLGGYCDDGASWDYRASSVQQTLDGGYIVAGYAESSDGDVTGNHGGSDFWVVKLGVGGEIEWQRCLGGSRYDKARDVQQTVDGGYILAGLTYSADGDVTGNHGDDDAWVVKIDAGGEIEWQRCLGGSWCDEAYSVQQTVDGGYIVAGDTLSDGGDVSGNHGSYDAWAAKLDADGGITWQRCLGGSGYDKAYSVGQTLDGGYILAGYTDSNDGNVSGNHGSYDAWAVKLDAEGTIVWQRCLGGSEFDTAYSVRQTVDSGYILAGGTSFANGEGDAWAVKLDADGAIAWQRCLGGSDSEEAYGVRQTVDGGYILAGTTHSNDGDVSGNHGWDDVWVVKLKSAGPDAAPDAAFTTSPTSGAIPLMVRFTDCSTGNPTAWSWTFGDGATSTQQHPVHTYVTQGMYTVSLTVNADVGSDTETVEDCVTVNVSHMPLEWQRCLGGSGSDASSIVRQTSDGGYIVAGQTNSTDGDVSGNHGDYDILVVKLDAGGETEWQRCLGGSDYEGLSSLQQTIDGGYLVGGDTSSNDGDVSGNHGGGDAWMVQMDAGGEIEWQRCLGGSARDSASSVQQTSDGGYIVFGEAESDDGDVSKGSDSYCDNWLVKLDPEGIIEWQNFYSSNAISSCGEQTDDGGYVLGGWWIDGQRYDGYVWKANNTGILQWECILGWGGWDYVHSVQQTADSGYIVAGVKGCGDRQDYIPDGLVVKLNATGATEWLRHLGGDDGEGFYSVEQTLDGGYVVAGKTWSNDGEVSGSHGGPDGWVVKLDTDGVMVWQCCLGGSDYDGALSAQQTSDGGYIIAGYTTSTDGDVTGNHGSSDIWVVKLEGKGVMNAPGNETIEAWMNENKGLE